MRIGPEPMTSAPSGRAAAALRFLLVGAVEVRRHRFELGGAGVDHLVDRAHVPLAAQVTDPLGQLVGERADLSSEKPRRLAARASVTA